MRFLVIFILGAAVLTTTLTNGVSCSDDIVEEEDVDIVVPKVHISRHFTTSDSKTGFPFALDPVVGALEKMLIPTSSSPTDANNKRRLKSAQKQREEEEKKSGIKTLVSLFLSLTLFNALFSSNATVCAREKQQNNNTLKFSF